MRPHLDVVLEAITKVVQLQGGSDSESLTGGRDA